MICACASVCLCVSLYAPEAQHTGDQGVGVVMNVMSHDRCPHLLAKGKASVAAQNHPCRYRIGAVFVRLFL